MADVSIEIKSKDTENKNVTTTISYVNGGTSDATLIQFAQQLIALTTDTYDSTTKVTKEVLL